MSLVHLEDVIIFSKDNEPHLVHLDHVLTLLEEGEMNLKLKKCFLFRNKIYYLGNVIHQVTLVVC